ncbi:hypothetical protein AAG906_027965 [Vitis piasezkii]
MPQATSTDPPATPPVPLAIPPPSQDFITISGSEFRGMVLLFRTLNATHDALFRKMRDIQAQQDRYYIILDQHTAILSQIQQHLSLAPPRSGEETITADVLPQATYETALEPSCPLENPAP